MHRFRKKSESKTQFNSPIDGVHSTTDVQNEALPTLPPSSDFRTSLILPALTRRFTLLRSYNGDPVGLEDLKTKFAEQRARGAPNQVSEEEEDMILKALGRMRFSAAEPDNNSLHSSSISPRGSTTDASISSSPPKSPRRSNRYSNNLFGSGRFRDYSYVRSVHRGGSNRSALSFAPSEVSTSTPTKQTRNSDDHQRPQTPEGGSSFAFSLSSSPNNTFDRDSTPTARSASLDPPSFYNSDANSSTGTEFRLSRTFSQEAFKRASLALEDVIREIEEEAEEPDVDDDIVLLRSPSAFAVHNQYQDGGDEPSQEEESLDEAEYTIGYETGTALSSDDQIQVGETHRPSTTSPIPATYSTSRTTSPTPRLPGYIPGMQRPMTPRDAGFESDDHSTSTTPKATPPRLPGVSGSPSTARKDSNASTVKQPSRTSTPLASGGGPGTPLFFSRTVNGRFTPEDRHSGDAAESDRDRHGSRRKHISLLSGQIGQESSSPAPSSTSRPGTPSSNSTWYHTHNHSAASRPTHIRSGSGHSRNGSVNSLADITSSDMHSYSVSMEATFQRSRSSETTRSTRSPPLPDSPLIDNGHEGHNHFGSPQLAQQGTSSLEQNRSPSVMSGVDSSSPFSFSRSLRSPTPNGYGTQGHPHAPNGSSVGRAKSPSFSESSVENVNGVTANFNSKSPSKRHQKTDSSMTGFTLSLESKPLVLSPLVNSSRSSLESEGSSYHSWDEGAGGRSKDRVKVMFTKVEAEPPEWHDLAVDKSENSAFGTFGQEENIVRQLSGLSKAEFASIQDKLIEVVTSKSYESGREKSDRAGSALRKRRPSTSQSNYSISGKEPRVSSPTPVVVRSASPSAAVVLATPPVIKPEQPQPNLQSSKANALLNSVIDSIQSPSKVPSICIPAPKQDTPPSDSPRARTASEVSSPTRRNRNLADALFGPEDKDGVLQLPLQLPAVLPLNSQRPVPAERSLHDNMSTPHLPRSPEPSGRLPMGQMSSPNLTIPDRNELTLEVQRKVDAATMALRNSPKLSGTGTVSRKKINRDLISSPTLVSASTSVDTIPLPSASPSLNSSPSFKLSQRIKKLRGTLRSKSDAIPSGGEVTPFPLDTKPSTPQTAGRQRSASRAETTSTHAGAASVTELGKFKLSRLTPPASSGPGLKGFMARFRKNKNSSDAILDPSQKRGDIPDSSASSMSFSPEGSSPQPQSAPASKMVFHGINRSASMRSTNHVQQQHQEDQKLARSMSVPIATITAPVHVPVESPEDEYSPEATLKDEMALRQLFDAASNLGLDQTALTNLVARSTSTSSRSTGWRTHTSLTPSWKSRPPDISEDVQESVQAPPGSPDSFSTRMAGPVIRKLSIKKHSDSLRRTQREREEAPQQILTPPSPPPQQQPTTRTPSTSRNTIVRRTIIMPSETKAIPIDINALLRKNSQPTTRKRRSGSGASIHSNRSIQDRAPTPPPPKSTGASGRRFSTDTASPPVPYLPHSFSSHLDVPSSYSEKPNSPYDSLFDMYAGDSGKVASAVPVEAQSDYDGLPPSESGPALEVIEMANGETIWSIVNGLRDDDTDSFYGNRASFASEYSLRESASDGVQVYFREHARTSSKGSASSFASRKKQTANRPETKVFFSSSAHIGRLIENLSKGLDSGSFNILPNRPLSFATTPSMGSESDTRWTVEERLEYMLGSMGSHS